ncbi:MAG TPA: SRPBCC family protein [Casimicrobiaceae bacterium]
MRAIAVLTLAMLPVAGLQAATDEDIEVRVKKNGAEVAVDVDCPVNASVAVIWEVLTDYDHMSEFLSDVQHSSVHARDGHTLQVYQKGKATRGLLSITFENLREVELVPRQEIRSRLISGDLKASAFTTRVVDDGTLVHIINSGRYTPKIWVPPVIGPTLIEAETRKHFGELRNEILRRHALGVKAPAASPRPSPASGGPLASEAPR